MKFIEAFNKLDINIKYNMGLKRSKHQIGYIIKKDNKYKVIIDPFLDDMDYHLTPEDKDADDWIVIDTNTLKEIKFITLEYQLQFINNKIQSHCMEKDGNLIYFYTPEVSSRFGEATDMARLQLSSIVYDVALKKTTKSRWHNLTNVYFDFLNKQFYRLEK